MTALTLTILGAFVAAFVFGARWLYRRWSTVDSYYEREPKDPPATDLTSWFGGDRSF